MDVVVDIRYVVDVSISMKNQFDYVRPIGKELIAELEKRLGEKYETPVIQASVTTYVNKFDQNGNVKTELKHIDPISQTEPLRQISQSTFQNGVEVSEGQFSGLLGAVEHLNSNLSPSPNHQLIIHLTDASNRTDETYTFDRVVGHANQANIPIFNLVLHPLSLHEDHSELSDSDLKRRLDRVNRYRVFERIFSPGLEDSEDILEGLHLQEWKNGQAADLSRQQVSAIENSIRDEVGEVLFERQQMLGGPVSIRLNDEQFKSIARELDLYESESQVEHQKALKLAKRLAAKTNGFCHRIMLRSDPSNEESSEIRAEEGKRLPGIFADKIVSLVEENRQRQKQNESVLVWNAPTTLTSSISKATGEVLEFALKNSASAKLILKSPESSISVDLKSTTSHVHWRSYRIPLDMSSEWTTSTGELANVEQAYEIFNELTEVQISVLKRHDSIQPAGIDQILLASDPSFQQPSEPSEISQ